MNAQTLRAWMTAAIAAPVILTAGAGVASAQSPVDPVRSMPAPAAMAAGPADAAPVPGGPAGPGGPADRGDHGPGGHHHRHHGMMGVRPDANGNLVRTDVLAAQQRQLAMFDRADANHDGLVSREEGKAFREQMREEWRAKRGSPPAAPVPPPKG